MKTKVIVGLLGLIIAVGVLGLVAWQKYKRDIAAGWPTVQGVITAAEVERSGSRVKNPRAGTSTTIVIGSGSGSGSGSGAAPSHQKYLDIWRIMVRYEYSVGAGRFSGRTADLGRQTTDRAEAEQQLARFPEGAPLTVHYNPQDPAESMVLP